LWAAAEAHGQRLQSAFASMRAGAKLPAHGVDSVCQWGEMNAAGIMSDPGLSFFF
jgi:ATP-dependent helicase/nuclease subunit B